MRKVLSLILLYCIVLSINFAFAADENSSLVHNSSLDDLSSPQISVCDVSGFDEANSQNLSDTSSKTVEIVQNNYDDYFDLRTGRILDDANILSGDVLKIGNISNRAFVIDRPLTLMPISPNDQISNGFIHLVSGSDGSTVTNLTINNTKGTLTLMGATVGQLHGIWLSNSNNNVISYNTIRIADAAGVYAMPMGWSSNNRIIYNDMKTYITTNIIMGQCHYNLISHNSLEVLSFSDKSVTNLIYFNPFGHADYSGSPLCKGNVISYNYLKGFCDMPMSIILQLVYVNHDDTVIANNTVIKGSIGINIYGNNVSVYGNKVLNSSTGISVGGDDFSVFDNEVMGNSHNIGISVEGNDSSKCKVFNNQVTYTDVSMAISATGSVDVFENRITIKNFGIGISYSGTNSSIFKNKINTFHDSGIYILGNNTFIDNNTIATKNIGIIIPASSTKLRYYNNSISGNRIISDGHGISIVGLVYNSVIVDNIIETNSSKGINIEITDEKSNTQLDNTINGIILNATSLIINDDNFYQYFDEEGYFNYHFLESQSSILILTFLTNKNLHFTDRINLISNKMNNLLFNVTIILEGDAEDSLIKDFNFMNFDKESIIVKGVNRINITNNIITCIFANGVSKSAILVEDICEDVLILDNQVYVNSKIDYAYAINIPSINPSNGLTNKRFSSGFDISTNTIIMISEGVAEAIYTDALVDSNFSGNKINILSNGYGYGIAFANIIGNLFGLNVTDNEIVIHSGEMAYLIEAYMVDDSVISNNNLYGESNGIYGVGIYRSENISIENNTIHVVGGDLNKISQVDDTLGIGKSAIAIIKNSNNASVKNNFIYVSNSNPIVELDSTDNINLTKSLNKYIIDNDNFEVYFTKKGKFKSGIIEEDGWLLLANLSGNQQMEVNSPLRISSYSNDIPVFISLTLKKASNSTITNISFVNSTISLKDSSNVLIENNIFNSTNSNIFYITGGKNNLLVNNSFIVNHNEVTAIILKDTQNNNIGDNLFNINASSAKIIDIEFSFYNSVNSNVMYCKAEDLIFISSSNSMYDNIEGNTLRGNASSIFGYYASKVNYAHIALNDIEIYGNSYSTNQSAIYLTDSSSRNNITENHIESFSSNADDYAVTIISSRNLFNHVVKNFLVSSNGSKRADSAVNAYFEIVNTNSPIDIYVSPNGDDVNGDGGRYHPFASISKAVSNAYNHAIIYVADGYFNESDINIDKNLTLIALNPQNVIINACEQQLFNISKEGTLLINGVVIQNAHNVEGGSAFVNNGKLLIQNSIICNSSSYFDNSNPIFNHDAEYGKDGTLNSGHTIDCSDTGKGGVILNYGELLIDFSVFYNNLGHIGGVIADYGKTKINSSIFVRNKGVHGGVIYTDSKSALTVENSIFNKNMAITSLDYCAIKTIVTSSSVEYGKFYSYYSDCYNPIGHGGVIYTNNTDLLIFNSTFSDNSAKSGGAIATQIDSFTLQSLFKSKVNLNVRDSCFVNNRAEDTRSSSGSIILNNYEYYSELDGAVIFGTFNQLDIEGCEFYYNQAVNSGGALYAKSNNGAITDSIFEFNTAGDFGGALDLSKNFIIMRSIISNNSARYGGAIEYDSYDYYNHIQDNLNIYNSTISNNQALTMGGAFNFGKSNVTVHNSNIVNNKAPDSSTIHSTSSNVIDMKYNYWGTSSNGYTGPDDSVWRSSGIDFRPWSKQWINWNPIAIEIAPDVPIIDVNPDNVDYGNHDYPKNGDSETSSLVSTGSSISTGKSVGGNGNVNGQGYNNGMGNGKYSGTGDGNNLGQSDGQSELINSLSRLPGRTGYNGQNSDSNNDAYDYSNPQVPGVEDFKSLSKINGSRQDKNLESVGMTANAASQDSSSSSGGDSGLNSPQYGGTDGKSVSKAFEIDKIEELLNEATSMFTFIILALFVILLLIVGYKLKENEYK